MADVLGGKMYREPPETPEYSVVEQPLRAHMMMAILISTCRKYNWSKIVNLRNFTKFPAATTTVYFDAVVEILTLIAAWGPAPKSLHK